MKSSMEELPEAGTGSMLCDQYPQIMREFLFFATAPNNLSVASSLECHPSSENLERATTFVCREAYTHLLSHTSKTQEHTNEIIFLLFFLFLLFLMPLGDHSPANKTNPKDQHPHSIENCKRISIIKI